MTAPLDERWLRGVGEIWKGQRRELWAGFGGTSMEPTIRAGEEVFIECGVEAGTGDVALLLLEGRLAVHRILGRSADGQWVLSVGDANLLPDQPTRHGGYVIGRVSRVRRGSDALTPAAPRRRALKWAVEWVSVGLFRASPRLAALGLRALRRLLPVARRSPAGLASEALGQPGGRQDPAASRKPAP